MEDKERHSLEPSEQLSVSDVRHIVQQLRSLKHTPAPDSLIPNVLARLGLGKVSVSSDTPIEPLIADLRNPQWHVRMVAVKKLGMLGEKAPVDLLTAALDDENESVRVASVQALGALGERASVEPLLAALQDKQRMVRAAAAQALGALGERASVEQLAIALKDEDESVRMAAAQAMETLREQALVEPLATALYDEQRMAHATAEQALEGLGEQASSDGTRNHENGSQQSVLEPELSTATSASPTPQMVALNDRDKGMHMMEATLDDLWPKLYPLLLSLVKRWVYASNVFSWIGQEADIAWDIVLTSIRRTFEYSLKAQSEGIPIVSLERLSIVIAKNCFHDLRRKDARLLCFDRDDYSQREQSIPEKMIDQAEAVDEKLYEQWLFIQVAKEIARFPDKMRRAVLIDIARRMDFNEPEANPTPLQQAFLEVGIRLQEYQNPLPDDPVARTRHASLVSLGYKRIAEGLHVGSNVQSYATYESSSSVDELLEQVDSYLMSRLISWHVCYP